MAVADFKMMRMEMIWPEAYENMDLLDGMKDTELAATGLMGWAHCKMGSKPPKNFGHVMVKIGKRLGIVAHAENLSEWADEYQKKEDDDEK